MCHNYYLHSNLQPPFDLNRSLESVQTFTLIVRFEVKIVTFIWYGNKKVEMVVVAHNRHYLFYSHYLKKWHASGFPALAMSKSFSLLYILSFFFCVFFWNYSRSIHFEAFLDYFLSWWIWFRFYLSNSYKLVNERGSPPGIVLGTVKCAAISVVFHREDHRLYLQ